MKIYSTIHYKLLVRNNLIHCRDRKIIQVKMLTRNKNTRGLRSCTVFLSTAIHVIVMYNSDCILSSFFLTTNQNNY